MNFYIVASEVTILSIILFWLIFKIPDLKANFKKILYFISISLPLCPVVNMFFKSPFYLLLYKILGIKNQQEPLWFILGIVTPIGAALEEIIKILPLLILLRRIRDEKRLIYSLGLILGLGFGISECWYLAFSFTQIESQYVKGFWNLLMILSGFGSERLLSIFMHIFLTGIIAFGITQNSLLKYLILAILFHSIINLPVALFQMGLLPQTICGILIAPLFCLLAFVFFKITGGIKRGEIKKGEIYYERK